VIAVEDQRIVVEPTAAMTDEVRHFQRCGDHPEKTPAVSAVFISLGDGVAQGMMWTGR
jgi:hypothetical protein